MAATVSTKKKRPGPLAKPGRVRVTVYLEEPLAEWGKTQPGGLSDLLRRLLSDAQQQIVEESRDLYPAELRVAYKRLIDRKLAVGLNTEEELELSQIRASFNDLDRISPVWEEQERASQAIDAELADIRRRIESLPARSTVR
jgi:hypothetical protein